MNGGTYPELYIDGDEVTPDRYTLEPEGARVVVAWPCVEGGYVNRGWRCDYGACQGGDVDFETWKEVQQHGKELHGERSVPAVRVLPFVNSAAIGYEEGSEGGPERVTVLISVGDPRGAFAMTVECWPDGERRLSVPHTLRTACRTCG